MIKNIKINSYEIFSSYKYYLTELGKETIVMALKIKEMVIIPAFSF
jgi:hypothetical protein